MNTQPNPAQLGASTEQNPIERDELLKALNELLEAERAGARVTLETANQMAGQDLAPLVMDIQHDEVRWCKMLIGVMRVMDVAPSRMTGAFYEKAMAIKDIKERLLFINRGQGWVVRRLQNLIPRIQEADIRSQLQKMLDAHTLNIRRVEELI